MKLQAHFNALLTLLLSSCATIEVTPEVRGTTVDSVSGKPISGATVRAWNPTLHDADSRVRTRSDGRFIVPPIRNTKLFLNSALIEANVSIEAHGYEPRQFPDVMHHSPNNISSVELGKLAMIKTKGQRAPDDHANIELSVPIVGDLMAEIKRKNAKTTRWGEISRNFEKLKTGMPQDEVERLLGKREAYPKERPSVWQYSPSPFNGRKEGDWNLVIHMKDKKISGFQLLKFVYGPPPG